MTSHGDGPLGTANPAHAGGGGSKLLGVEAARGVAAVLVVLVHVTSVLAVPNSYGVRVFGGLFDFGRAGVDFFFVLSGFIIAYVHSGDINQASRLGPYWKRRLWRIYPAYLVASLIWQALLVVSPTATREEQDWVHILASWTLFPSGSSPILGVGWTLRHELLFYGLFSLLLVNRQAGMLALAAWGLGIVWNMAFYTATGEMFFPGQVGSLLFHTFNIQFFFGLAVAAIVRRDVCWRPGLVLLLGAALFLATGLQAVWGPLVMHEWPPRHVAYAAGAAMALYGLAMLDRTGRRYVPGWMVLLGSASYSIYLMHTLFAVVGGYMLRFVRQAVPLPLEAAFVIVVVGAIAGSVVFSRLVEQPLLRLGRMPRASVVPGVRQPPAQSASP